jgi:raffinose/stachyose/melibiose transport system permease protein
MGGKMKIKSINGNNLFYYLGMLLPALLIYFLFVVMIFKTFRISFFEWGGFGAPTFVGLKNYLRLFSDYRFLSSLRNIGILIGATIMVQVGLGIILAYILTDFKLKFSGFFKMVIFLPVVISNVAVSLYFIKFYDYQYGLLNTIMVALGFEKMNFIGSGPNVIFYALIPQTWQYIGMMFIIAYAGFTTVSKDYVDAAKIDGLNSFGRLIHLYIPVSWSSISACFLIAMVGPLKAFDHIYLITTGGCSDQMSHIPATLMYYLGFQNYEYGYGSAIGVIICGLAILTVLGFNKLTSRRT